MFCFFQETVEVIFKNPIRIRGLFAVAEYSGISDIFHFTIINNIRFEEY